MNKNFILWKSCGNLPKSVWKSPCKSRVKNLCKTFIQFPLCVNPRLSHQLSHFSTSTFPPLALSSPPQSFPLFHIAYYNNY